MHTYALLGGINDWVDSRSQSITIESMDDQTDGDDPWPLGPWIPLKTWGQAEGGNCRVNGAGGSVGCSVANTSRVAFYGPAINSFNLKYFVTLAYTASWRDDRGVPHRNVWVPDVERHVAAPLASPGWWA
jgi:hypothetical protein